nr:F-box/FBD/LRR-repeat protein At1g13570-like [Ipomoea batatas]
MDLSATLCCTLKRLHLRQAFVEVKNAPCSLPNITSLCFEDVQFYSSNLSDRVTDLPMLQNLSFDGCVNIFDFNITAPKLANLDLIYVHTLVLDAYNVQRRPQEQLPALNVEYLKLLSNNECYAFDMRSSVIDLLQMCPKLCVLDIDLKVVEVVLEEQEAMPIFFEEHHAGVEKHNMPHTLKLTNFEALEFDLLFIKGLLAGLPAVEDVLITTSGNRRLDSDRKIENTQKLVCYPCASQKAKIVLFSPPFLPKPGEHTGLLAEERRRPRARRQQRREAVAAAGSAHVLPSTRGKACLELLLRTIVRRRGRRKQGTSVGYDSVAVSIGLPIVVRWPFTRRRRRCSSLLAVGELAAVLQDSREAWLPGVRRWRPWHLLGFWCRRRRSCGRSRGYAVDLAIILKQSSKLGFGDIGGQITNPQISRRSKEFKKMDCASKKLKKMDEATSIASLPQEIILKILTTLPPKSAVSLSCTSKFFHSFIPQPHFGFRILFWVSSTNLYTVDYTTEESHGRL